MRYILLVYIAIDIFRYKSKWHVMPLHVQKLILFIMQKSTRNYMLVIGGIYVASLEGFATVRIFFSSITSVFFLPYTHACARPIKFISSVDDLLVLGFEYIHILLYGNLFDTMT